MNINIANTTHNYFNNLFNKYIKPIYNINNIFHKKHFLIENRRKYIEDLTENNIDVFFINAAIRSQYELEEENKNEIYYKNSIDKIFYIEIDNLSEMDIKTIAFFCFFIKEIAKKSIILFGRKRDKKPIIDNLSMQFHQLIGAIDEKEDPLFKGGVYFINKNKEKEYEFLMATNIRKTSYGYEQINLPFKYELKAKLNFNTESLYYIETISSHSIIGNLNISKDYFPNFPIIEKKLVYSYDLLYEDYFKYQGIFDFNYIERKINKINKGILIKLYPGIEDIINSNMVDIINRSYDFLLLELYGSGNGPEKIIKHLKKINIEKYAVSQQISHTKLLMETYETGMRLKNEAEVIPLMQIDSYIAWLFLILKEKNVS